jgi:hypothetical protein
MLSNVKTSDEALFTHFASDRSWATHVANSMKHSIQTMDLPTFMRHRSNEHGYPKVYMTRRLTNPATNSLLLELAPVMNSLPSSTTVQSEISLWMTSGHTSASPHYDMEHNFFLQVNGSKRFIISSPSHYALFQPFSSLHPSWRQSRHRNLTSSEAIKDRLMDPKACEYYPERKNACVQKASQNNDNGVCVEKVPSSGAAIGEVAPGIHEVILHPGQMLYIPPFFFHSVTTLDPHSVSINAWVGSKPLTASNKLTEQVPLPYAPNADSVTRIATVGALINLSLIRLGRWYSPQEFAKFLELRVKGIRFDSDATDSCRSGDGDGEVTSGGGLGATCNDTYPFSECTDLKIAYQGIFLIVFFFSECASLVCV